MNLDIKKAQAVAKKSTIKAGNFLKAYQAKVTIKKFKHLQDIQTDADLKAEDIIIKLIKKNFPKHNIFSEEAGLIDNHSNYTWIIDPLDGTKEYFKGQSHFLSLVSLESKKEILTGCVYNPNTKNIFFAAKNMSAYKNSTKISVSKTKSLSHSIISVKLPDTGLSKQSFQFSWQYIQSLSKQCYKVRGAIHVAQDICYIAQGAREGFCIIAEPQPKWWDVASALIIVKQAGGKITDKFGKPIKNQDLSKGLVVSNGLIHNQLLEIIKQYL